MNIEILLPVACVSGVTKGCADGATVLSVVYRKCQVKLWKNDEV